MYFKPLIKAKILGSNLTVLADIKDLALKTETLEGERKLKQLETVYKLNPSLKKIILMPSGLEIIQEDTIVLV
jgi:hypothetical protein